MEDSMIVDLYWARSEQAIAESDRKYGRYCLSIARSIVELEEDAEECVNDTWLRSWNAIPPQRPGVLSAFFGKITRNLSLDRWRKNRAATARAISDFLRRQPELDRILFVRRYFHLESLAGLEARFGLTESPVKSRLHRTRKRLRNILEQEGVGL